MILSAWVKRLWTHKPERPTWASGGGVRMKIDEGHSTDRVIILTSSSHLCFLDPLQPGSENRRNRAISSDTCFQRGSTNHCIPGRSMQHTWLIHFSVLLLPQQVLTGNSLTCRKPSGMASHNSNVCLPHDSDELRYGNLYFLHAHMHNMVTDTGLLSTNLNQLQPHLHPEKLESPER